MNKTKKALIGNMIILILEVISLAWIMSGISASRGPLDGPNLESLKYYTVDSNILMGIVALAAVIAQYQVLKGKLPRVSRSIQLLKLTGTVSVTLTMLITLFFLGPTIGRMFGFFSLYANSSLFLHLINPVAAIFVFLRHERSDDLPLSWTPAALIPTVLYVIYYVALSLQHIEGERIAAGYDWYGFFVFGISRWPLVVAVILLITYGITLTLWKLNREKAKSDPGPNEKK